MRDLRRYSKQTTFRLVVGFIAILFGVGLGLIYIFYGRAGAWLGFVCLIAGLAPLVIIWGVLLLLGWIAKKVNSK